MLATISVKCPLLQILFRNVTQMLLTHCRPMFPVYYPLRKQRIYVGVFLNLASFNFISCQKNEKWEPLLSPRVSQLLGVLKELKFTPAQMHVISRLWVTKYF